MTEDVLASLSFFRVASLRGSVKIKAYSNKSWRLLRCPFWCWICKIWCYNY